MLTPEQEAAYSLDYGVSRADLKPEVQAAYDRLLAERQTDRPSLSPPPESVRDKSVNLRRLPTSVRYARSLLFLQGGIWAWLAAASTVTGAAMVGEVLAGHRASGAAIAGAAALSAAALTGLFAATKIRLAIRLRDGRDRTRKTAVGVEVAMTCLGALMTTAADPSGGMPADMVTLAALVGGGLSAAAAIGLLRRPARQYFAPSCSRASASDDGNGDSSAAYSRLLPTLAIRLGNDAPAVFAAAVI